MKKLFSLFAALLMLLSIVSIAFAEEEDMKDIGVATEEDFVVSDDVVADESGNIVATADSTEVTEDSAVVITSAPAETVDAAAEVPAADASAESLATPEVVEDAGVTPDQTILWTAEQVVESVDVALTLDDAAQAEKSLEYAEESLAEAQVMASEENADATEKALEEQQEDVTDAEAAASDISLDDPAEELAVQAELQSKFQTQYDHTVAVKTAILTRMQSKWTPEKYAKISGNFAKMEAKHLEVKTKLDARQVKIEAKVQAKTGKTSDEVKKMRSAEDNQVKEQSRETLRAEQESGDSASGEQERIRTEAQAGNQESADASEEDSSESSKGNGKN
jgi:hypothetical protein